MFEKLENSTLMITGGTGSFGNAVLKYLLESSKIKEIRIFSRDEKKQEDMRNQYNDTRIKFHIGDVRDYIRLSEAMIGVDYIFHAAALKQVPSCEFYPIEAVKTNILGAENVMNAAIKNNIKTVVFLSTDKAVYPINTMGMTKALMEKLVIAKARLLCDSCETKFCITRYGNIMGSRGSVIPLFLSQIKENKPISITDIRMTRFLMTLEESVYLVLYAFNYGQSGDILVQKSDSTSIGYLVSALMDIFNYKLVKNIGIRHGEKLHEVLVSREEMVKADDLDQFYKIPMDNRDLNYDKYSSNGTISELKEYTSENNILPTHRVIQKLMKLPIVNQTLLLEKNRERKN
jgi:UDP-glucose 4-epimerase